MYTSIKSIRDLAATVRGRRLSLGLSQAQVATRARVSRQWISEFEGGKPAAELRLVMQLLDALELSLALNERSDTADGRSGSAKTVDLDDLLDEYRKQ